MMQKRFPSQNNEIMIILRCSSTPLLCFQIAGSFCREARKMNKKIFFPTFQEYCLYLFVDFSIMKQFFYRYHKNLLEIRDLCKFEEFSVTQRKFGYFWEIAKKFWWLIDFHQEQKVLQVFCENLKLNAITWIRRNPELLKFHTKLSLNKLQNFQ